MMSTASLPNGKAALIVLESAKEFGNSVDRELVKLRHQYAMFSSYEYVRENDSYQVDVEQIRFPNGEGKVILENSARGKDVFIFGDISNYSITYQMYSMTNHMGPDEHFQDIKRVVSALAGKAKRITVVMPLLYASRQNKRRRRESADCALALQELERLGVSSVVTFDVHDPTINNAVPLLSFQNIYPTYEIVKEILQKEPELDINQKNLVIISPDTGGIDRAIYYSEVLGLDVSIFYKRRDYSQMVNGKHPVVAYEYIGKDLTGKDVLITDDMISSGDSVLSIARALKERNVNRVMIAVSFGLFTDGFEKFQQYYEEGLIHSVYTTNLSYLPSSALEYPWLHRVDLSRYLAMILDSINRDESIEPLLDSTGVIKDLLL